MFPELLMLQQVHNLHGGGRPVCCRDLQENIAEGARKGTVELLEEDSSGSGGGRLRDGDVGFRCDRIGARLSQPSFPAERLTAYSAKIIDHIFHRGKATV